MRRASSMKKSRRALTWLDKSGGNYEHHKTVSDDREGLASKNAGAGRLEESLVERKGEAIEKTLDPAASDPDTTQIGYGKASAPSLRGSIWFWPVRAVCCTGRAEQVTPYAGRTINWKGRHVGNWRQKLRLMTRPRKTCREHACVLSIACCCSSSLQRT
ncbi:hypothetical protein VTN96DRAFT_8628 [Rasamsonia emersonii]